MTADPLDAFPPGAAETVTYRATSEMVDDFAAFSGDDNPLHMDAAVARAAGFRDRVSHGAILNAHLSRLIGTKLPGQNALWTGQQVDYLAPIYPGDEIEITGTVRHVSRAARVLVLAITAKKVATGDLVARGKATVHLPEKITTMGPTARPLENLRIAVSGASRGLGRAVALELGRHRSAVLVHYHRDQAGAESAATEIAGAGGTAKVLQGDLATDAGRRAFTERLRAEGAIDGFVHAATPPIRRAPWEETPEGELDLHLDVGVKGADAVCRAIVPGMKERRFGRIVFVLSSYAWGRPPGSLSPYVIAKHALRGLVSALAVELGPHGICVNAVSPSLLETDSTAGLSAAAKKAEAMQAPLRRLGGLDEVARAVAALLGPAGSFVNGADLPIAGGSVM